MSKNKSFKPRHISMLILFTAGIVLLSVNKSELNLLVGFGLIVVGVLCVPKW